MKKWLRHFFHRFFQSYIQPILETVFAVLFKPFFGALFPEREHQKTVSRFSLDDIPLLPRSVRSPEEISPNTHIISLFSYKDPRIQALIWELKYHRNGRAMEFAAHALAEHIVAELEEKILFHGWPQQSILTTIPVTAHRLRERTYSQTDLLCRAVVKAVVKQVGRASVGGCSVTYRPDIVEKIRETTRQNKTTSRAERLTNLHGAFRTKTDSQNKSVANGKYIILIDDVTTTGATINEIRQTLIVAGARDVLAFTVAH